MKTCIYTKNKFSEADGEHILQNFLGARWISHDIVSNEIQSLFGKTIDSALEEGLREIRSLIGTKGGRGGDAPVIKNLLDSNSTKYHLKPGGIPFLAEPTFKLTPRENGYTEISAKLGTNKQLHWLIAKLKEAFPHVDFNASDWEEKTFPHKEYLQDKLHLRSGIGGKDYFRGLLKSAFNLIAVNNSSVALSPCFDRLRDFIVNGNGEMKDHIRWLSSIDELPVEALGQFDHVVVVYTRGANVDGVVQFFGGISHLIRLSNDYHGPELCYSYQVNPLRNTEPAEIRNSVTNSHKFPDFDNGHIEPGPMVWPIYNSILCNLLARHSMMATENEILRIADETLGTGEQEVSDESLEKFYAELDVFIRSRLKVPGR